MGDFVDGNIEMFDFTTVFGYGESIEEARSDFNREFFKWFGRLSEFAKLLDTDALKYIEVDCFGKPIISE